MKTCKKHIESPVFVYRECPGCELQGLRDQRDQARDERDQLKAELKSIKSDRAACWAEFKAQGRQLDQIKAENEALQKGLADWQSVVAAVKREIPERFTLHSRGNAPGHGHSTPGVWDDDNGALAGKECAWCKAWSAAMSKESGQ